MSQKKGHIVCQEKLMQNDHLNKVTELYQKNYLNI